MIFQDKVEDYHMKPFMALADGLVHEVRPEVVQPFVDRDFPQARVEEYTTSVTKPLQIPGFREYVQELINSNATGAVQLFCLLMSLLSLRVLSPILTGTTKLVTEMDEEEREKVLLSMRDSPLEFKNKAFGVLLKLTISTFQRVAPDAHMDAMGYPKHELREQIYEDYKPDTFKFTMRDPPASNDVELSMPDIDVVIVGSGSGAGVAAHTLSRAGKKVLVLEKGTYFVPSELNFDELSGYKALYENQGVLSTLNGQLALLAGATFGGGSTVNWSACLKTPFKVRQEWSTDHGVNFVATEEYDNEMDYVLKQMGASTEHIVHSKSNQAVMDGCSKLGYQVKAVPQNNGTHTNHSCGFCHLGCKWGIKQGSLACWLKDAADHGAEFMDGVRVERIVRDKRGLALGLVCVNTRNGYTFTITGPKKYMLCGGSLQTPVLLQKSGFRNKHIGKHLKLHPISALLCYWGPGVKTDPHYNSIMTSVCLEVDDLDGKAHGVKIETLLHSPMFESTFFPWLGSDKVRQDLLKYQGLSSFIMLARDTSEGTVTFDPKKEDTLVVDYTINKFDKAAIAKALVVAMDICYIEGAQEIIHPYFKCGTFYSNKPKEERNIHDADYQEYRKKVESITLPNYGVGYGSAHQMSTCRMSGKGPKDGACDTKGRLFECDNVYVADASVMPTASGANPMVSTMALSRHISLGMVNDKPAKL